MGKSSKKKSVLHRNAPYDDEQNKFSLLRGETSTLGVDLDGDTPMDENVNNSVNSPGTKTHRAGQYTLEQREAVTTVRNCSDKDYYGILGLQNTCTRKDICTAYRKLAFLTHPDQNKFEDAEIAFKKLAQAYEVLKDPESRAEYDKVGDRYMANPVMDPYNVFGEVFASNAGGDETDASDDSDDNSSLNGDGIQHRPCQEVLDVYRGATASVNQYLTAPDGLAPNSGFKEISKFNKKIKKINQRLGRPEEKFLIKCSLLVGFRIEYRQAMETLDKNPGNEQAANKMARIRRQFESVKREYCYPDSWKLPATPGDNPENGQKILGHIPRSKNGESLFIVEKKDYPSRILIQRYSEVDSDIAQSYLNAPEMDRKDVRFSQDRYNRTLCTNYKQILGWDNLLPSNPSQWNLEARRALPQSYGLVQFKDGSTDILNRTALRKLLGKGTADAEVDRFYQQRGITPPWTFMPRLPAPEQSKRIGGIREDLHRRDSEGAIKTMLEQNQQHMKALTDAITQLVSQISIKS
ncbi:hypothetical protein EYZ11_012142 [Aspergillus tanneri]|uniref:J domain-containing protein n=1 Tax=Aspergillus tanneri TaxID=1220188 RepID=A0A4S3J0Z2_9EURO|nr:uncharacterized protein ATNIH1004_001698 [Aspergillus tanneri]KAA8652793.1 hypothetical protein ATNIH1004_001698 [Aspergillus tanneri]THC88409.1 hypothetical protein EYZ11_012142 [Aspergillus tanneri]